MYSSFRRGSFLKLKFFINHLIFPKHNFILTICQNVNTKLNQNKIYSVNFGKYLLKRALIFNYCKNLYLKNIKTINQTKILKLHDFYLVDFQ